MTDTPPSPSLTVAICTRDRPEALARAMAAITPQLHAHDQLLIVHNAPGKDAPVPPVCDTHQLRVVVEPRPGLDWARNRALVECRTTILCFTDDDCVPAADWLAVYRDLFQHNPDVDLASGTVLPLSLDTPAQQLFEAYRGFPKPGTRRWLVAPSHEPLAARFGNTGTLVSGANFAIRHAPHPARRLLRRGAGCRHDHRRRR